MTPDLLEQGARRIEERRAALEAGRANTESGGRSASGSRVAHPTGEVDVTHGRILYLEDVSVSFSSSRPNTFISSARVRGMIFSILPAGLQTM